MNKSRLCGLSLRLAIWVAIGSSAIAAQADTVVYDAIPAPVPGNVASLGPEAYSGKEIGDMITLAAGPRVLKTVDVLLSSWACETGSWSPGPCATTPGATFTHPITLNIYGADGVTLLGSATQTFTIPYRPSPDTVNCTGGKWFDGLNCYNGKAHVVTFDSAALSSITLPDTFVFAVVYNTTHHGANPIGVSGPEYQANAPYDSLNVGFAGLPSVGTDVTGSDGIYWHTTYLSFYCDGGVGGSSFRLDTAAGCWHPNGTIPVRFVTTPPAVEVTLSGFNHPVDPTPTLNKAKAGQAIPLKFYVATPGGVPVTDLASVDVIMATVPCNDLDAVGTDPIEQYASGSSGLINQGGGYYQFNWKTVKGSTGCKVVSLGLPSGYDSTPDKLEAYFQFFK